MVSPFPGMDPYLERFWNQAQGSLIVYIADDLNESLPPRYRATLRGRQVKVGADDPFVVRRVEIVDYKLGDRAVTAIEVLSAHDKSVGETRQQFERQRDEYRRRGVSRVEIDLLRAGKRGFDVSPSLSEVGRLRPYFVTVYPGHEPNKCGLQGINLRHSLPVVGIPLREHEADHRLDLQPLIERVYRTGRFPVDYDNPCEPPLEGDDEQWARALLKAKRGSEPNQ